MPQEQPSFLDVIANAQRPKAEMPSSPFGVSLPPGIRAAEGPGKVPGGAEADFECQVKRFQIPGDEQEYKEVIDRSLRGEILLRPEQSTFTKDGDYIVVLIYLEPIRGAAPAARPGGAPDIEPQAAPRRAP